jgi:hypothetical protein
MPLSHFVGRSTHNGWIVVAFMPDFVILSEAVVRKADDSTVEGPLAYFHQLRRREEFS